MATITNIRRRTIAHGVKHRFQKDHKLKHANKTKIMKLTKAAQQARRSSFTAKTTRKPERTEKPRGTIIMAHRGGNFGPNNSLKNFRGAIKHQVEGVEFDVSLKSLSLTKYASIGLDKQGQSTNGRSRW